MVDLTVAVRSALRAAADPSRAPGQQAYMKSAMPFLGVRVPEVRRTTRSVVSDLDVRDTGVLVAAATGLWDGATYREERYAATALLGLRPLRGDISLAPLIEHMARTGAWWDHVDELAHRVADLHDAHPTETAALVRGWATDDVLWVRRLAILGQLGRKERTDVRLLAEVVEPNRADPEFFIRKAIGWALREVAYVDPGWVRAYVAEHELSPLTRREALKRIGSS
ncbi:DNA alkylation repair protein [Nocardioides silvaticus]|uniref:DNA alkylation repair protein n=1 Tax=Nocardioides silvaticus TaxID=2201891 RepID=A0A316TLG4_9ACTN|nr:DNA alkylation repair protein [Nocardioides silvaticus]PWN04628.1 DNA alkylation repair protein [Nocardioides silvaticus]